MSIYMVDKRNAISEGVICMIIKLSKRYTMQIIMNMPRQAPDKWGPPHPRT